MESMQLECMLAVKQKGGQTEIFWHSFFKDSTFYFIVWNDKVVSWLVVWDFLILLYINTGFNVEPFNHCAKIRTKQNWGWWDCRNQQEPNVKKKKNVKKTPLPSVIPPEPLLRNTWMCASQTQTNAANLATLSLELATFKSVLATLFP